MKSSTFILILHFESLASNCVEMVAVGIWFLFSDGSLLCFCFLKTAGRQHRSCGRMPRLCATQAGRGSVSGGESKEEGQSLGVRLIGRRFSVRCRVGRDIPATTACLDSGGHCLYLFIFFGFCVAGLRRRNVGKPKATWASCDKRRRAVDLHVIYIMFN